VFGSVCKKEVTYLNEGQPAPCMGYLFTPEEEFLVRSKVEKFDQLDELSKKQDELINILSNRLDISSQKEYNLKEELKQVNNDNQIEKIVYFCLGLVVGIGVSKTIK
ncbi:MAG: hypothetical protein EBZ95_04805, partial [Chitinophagia bacterium]|nr:hypothetical protein [Chitinophagia bacterium]